MGFNQQRHRHIYDVLLPTATNPTWAPTPRACGAAQELHPALLQPSSPDTAGQWGGDGTRALCKAAPPLTAPPHRAVTALQVPQHLAGRLCYLATRGGERKGNSSGGTRSAPRWVGVPRAPPPRQPPRQRARLPAQGPASATSPRAPRASAVHRGASSSWIFLLRLLGSCRASLCWTDGHPAGWCPPCRQAGSPHVPKSLLPEERAELLHLQTCSGWRCVRLRWCQPLLRSPGAQNPAGKSGTEPRRRARFGRWMEPWRCPGCPGRPRVQLPAAGGLRADV